MNTFNSAGTISVINGKNTRELYEHQIDAMTNLNELNRQSEFNTLLVLPTGGGKTLTAVWWLLKNAVDKGKKILWVAHRHLLLEQAADTFQRNAYSNNMINYSSFKYRIISGKHDRAIHIKSDDNVLIVGKDSLTRNLGLLKEWLKDEEEIFLVIDEAHHSTAKSYRRIIEYVRNNTKNVKLLGLTATPFRTATEEAGLLAKIFTDDIVYKIDLKDLIKRGILSRPEFEEYNTEVEIGENLGLNALRSIELLDNLPEDVANEIASNKLRNAKIVQQYINNKNKYRQTLVFAVNRIHAFTLKGLFEKAGVSAGVIVSGTKAEFIGIDISNEENERNINNYRNGDINVLINVNILTEGVDLPQTKTVFLTRPTVSSILMTQMIGRALRGEKAGGTADAYIVSFIDNWKESITWVNAESLFETEGEFKENTYNYAKKEIRLISIAKIEEFAQIIDDTVDTTELEAIDFIKRVPLGMYSFVILDDNYMERNYQVLVYDSTKMNYDEMIAALPELFASYDIKEEILEKDMLDKLCSLCEETYFYTDMLPTYDESDIRYILKYYAQKECAPNFIEFSKLDREKLDVSIIAKQIHEEDMRQSEKKDYIEELWNKKEELKIYYNKKMFFVRQLQIELDKLDGLFETTASIIKNVKFEERDIEEMTLQEIMNLEPKYGRKIKETIFKRHLDSDENYVCAHCGKKSHQRVFYQIDHILPMSKGGLTKVENLQLLCRTCNLIKSDNNE
ncbi:DEAD/DEAH box helicase family protein [Clostridium estertheticum]|uniref:DEAD/DEAH box helicase family protein n=1 Tax=Clostridium estertheticum TaxID=238834 RepID=UPI002714C2C9|nr:DEAD/DEAH box helicase family protein [Clostridium estertheticum]